MTDIVELARARAQEKISFIDEGINGHDGNDDCINESLRVEAELWDGLANEVERLRTKLQQVVHFTQEVNLTHFNDDGEDKDPRS